MESVKIELELANLKDIKSIINILENRCVWMERNNIRQWKSNSYTVSFNVDYFKEEIEKKRVYVARVNRKVCGIFLLRDNDSLWQDFENAFYIHHLATDMDYNGLGRIMIEYIKYIALNHNKTFIRLDCVKDNEKLNKYYEKLGFALKLSGTIRTYEYNLRELKIEN